MEEQKTMSLGEALRIIMDKVGNIRVPVREKEIAMALEDVAADLYECIRAVENKEKEEPVDEAVDEPVDKPVDETGGD